MKYEYYVYFIEPDLVTVERPAGLFRVASGTYWLQAMSREGKWIDAPQKTKDLLNGQADLIKVTKDQAKQAVKNRLPGLTAAELDQLLHDE